jgi:hypothetical protein
MLRFKETSGFRHWGFFVLLLFPTAIVSWLSLAYSVVFAFIFGIPVVIGWLSWAVGRTQQVRIGDGQIVWHDTGVCSPSRRVIRISDIASIEMTRDEDGRLFSELRMKDGSKKYLEAGDRLKAVDAIVEECPEIEIKKCY